jgi:DNA polymerase-3 subunit alpha (Gram-positive type)
MTRGIDAARRKIKEIRNNPEAKQKEEDLLTTLEACYEFYMRGFEFSAMDIYDSDPVRFLISGEKKLRPPFVAVSGLGDTAAFDLAENRAGSPFISIEDISCRCKKVSKTNIEQLRDYHRSSVTSICNWFSLVHTSEFSSTSSLKMPNFRE